MSLHGVASFRANFLSHRFLPRGSLRLLSMLCVTAGIACAEPLPLWEAGAGLGTAHLAHYRGSNQYRNWLLPVPFLVYRGETLKVDDRRLHGRIFDTDRVELDFSLNGSAPVKNNLARAGMPDLDATLEFGPSLDFFLFRSADRRRVLELRLPVRKAVASDFSHVTHIGWVAQPNLNFDVKDLMGEDGLNLGLQAGVLYADRDYNRYFYSVDPENATPSRPAYSAGGGYGGSAWLASLSKRSRRTWVGGYARWDSVKGAVFEDSPLVRSTVNFTFGIAFAWIFDQSDRKIDVPGAAR